MHNKDLLVSEVVPKYFGQSKYESFARQLNGWGFKRLTQAGNDNNAYYHECFLRGLPRLAVLMTRAKPNEGRQVPCVEGEPNFYEMDKTHRLPDPGIPNQFYQHHPPAYGPGGGGGASAGQIGMSSTSAGQYYSNPNAGFPEYYNPEPFYQHPPPPQYYGYPPPNMASAQGEQQQQQQGYRFPPAASVARYSNAFQPYSYPSGDRSEVAGINPMQQQQQPPFYPMPYGGPPPSQYNQHGHHFHNPFSNTNDTPSDAPPSATSRPMKSEEDPPSNDKDETVHYKSEE